MIWWFENMTLIQQHTINKCYKQKYPKSGQVILSKTMYKVWIMGLKQHNLIKWKCYKIYLSHTGLELGYNCKKYKDHLKMMENEQNFKKNTGKVIQSKTWKKCRQTTDTG